MNRFTKSLLTTVCALSVATVALAGSHAEGKFAKEVAARQAQMTLISFNLGILGDMAKGDVAYDSESASQAASDLAAASALMMAAAWPQGSDNASIKGTRALPAAWEKWPDIATKGQDLVKATAAMADAAGTDLDALRGAIGPVGQACGACHKAYRAPAN